MVELRKLSEDHIQVWETGSKNNESKYDSKADISTYRRTPLSYVEIFLNKKGEFAEANKIQKHLGKILRVRTIPELIPTNDNVTDERLSHLKSTIESYIEEDGLDLNPDFQRGHVWSFRQRVKYLEFIFQGGKTPPIWLNHEGWMSTWEGEMVIVDGKQRLTSILMFLDNEIPIFKGLDEDGFGYYAKELDALNIIVKIGINNLPDRKSVLKWYLEMNEGQTPHKEEEFVKVRKLIERGE